MLELESKKMISGRYFDRGRDPVAQELTKNILKTSRRLFFKRYSVDGFLPMDL